MSVRAKFKVMSKTENYKGSWEIRLLPVIYRKDGAYDPPPENKEFYEATPGGEITLAVVATTVADQFTPGISYYVDFLPAE